MRRRVLWSSLLLLPAAVVGGGVLVAVEARDRLPALLSWAVSRFAPDLDLELGTARFAARDRLVLEDVVLAFDGAREPFFAAERLEVEFGLRDLLGRRVRAISARDPEVRWTPASRPEPSALAGLAGGAGADEKEGTEQGTGGGWTIGRVSASDGSAELALGSGPPVAFDFDLSLEEVGTGEEAAARDRSLAVSNLRVGTPDAPLVAAPRVEASLSLAALRRGRLDALRVVRPEVDLPADFLAGRGGGDDPGAPPDVSIGRLEIEDGRLHAAGTSSRPQVDLAFALVARDVGTAPSVAGRVVPIEVRDVRLTPPGPGSDPLLTMPRATAEVSVEGLLDERRIHALRIPEGSLLLDAAGRSLLLSSAGSEEAAGSAPARAEEGYRIGRLEVGSLSVHLAELGPPLPDVTFEVHTTLDDVPLSAAAAALADERQTIELAQLALYSPFDPFKKVVTIGSVFVDFTIGGLTRQEIAHVKMLRPTIYLAEDLFWYMANERGDATGSAPTPWTIARFEAELGSLVLEIGRTERVGLPITFETEATDVQLDSLADLELAATLNVPEETYRFPDYELLLVDVNGDLHFDYPPGRNAENFVSTLYADVVEWRDYRITESWLSLTFDPHGINGTFGGAGYEGYVNGGLTVPYAWSEPWVGWVSASEIDLADLTAVLAEESVEMTGALDASVALTVANRSLETARGELSLPDAGRVEITRLAQTELPPDWPAWQRDLSEIAIDALADFPYEKGTGHLRYEAGVGRATLELAGPRGERSLELRYFGEGGDPMSLALRAARADAEAEAEVR